MRPMPADRRPFVYAGFDLAFAAIYVCIPLTFARTADLSFEIASGIVAGVAVLAAVGTFARREWGWWMALASCGALLVCATVLLVLLAMSAAYLHGVYGAFGKGAATMALIAMSLVVELYVLLPAFQLRYLLSAAGRAAVKRA